MARITDFEKGQMDRFQLHDSIEAKYYIHEYDDKRVLQISTFGRSSRQDKGKLSQTFQLDEESGRQLYAILKQAFGIE
ncbi:MULTISPECIES: methionyl-tRNA formyltransferase [unclassified Phyllobacterium]|uniref:methionyl-tRNA formyltransferase n=1 Tax=Phyllobacterium TaxID=28100 RepID=UPI000DD89E47|nr:MULTISPECIES: methionyl-tRNA formyltransferase [unclassified Phyllobacterium]MBA8904087.1 hypothetical protein [Phyllobacterium sp. P30BS-XVII]UGX87696.1 methionyl-tRNA formyltransferase [Phyllobacterium sp. T1293]